MGKIIRSKAFKYLLISIPVILAVWFFLVRPKQLTALVRRVPVENRVVSRTVSAKGEVKASLQADMTFIAAGKITNVNVKKGDEVKKGELLARLDTSAQAQNIQYYKDSRDIAMRTRDLFVEQGQTNVDALGGEDEYQIKLRQYEETISQAEAAYQAQIATLSNYYIYAPFDGTVISIDKEAGETALAGQTVLTVANLNNFVFEISIDQEDYGIVKSEQPVRIQLDSYDRFNFETTVSELPLTADLASGLFDIQIPIEADNEHKLAVGMYGDAYIDVLKSKSEVRALTIDEIFYNVSDDPYVWIVENSKLKKLPVDLGIEGDIYTEILTEVDEVVVPASDGQKLTEGYTARIIN